METSLIVGNWAWSWRRIDVSNGNLLQDVILGDRLAGQQALEDRALAVGDRGDLGDRFERGRRVIAGVFAERAFHLLVIGIDREFDHDLGVSRHLHVVADRLGKLYGRTAQAASHEPVVGRIARLHLAGIHRQWIDADHQRAAELLSHLGGMGDVLAEAVVGGGEDAELLRPMDLHSIVSDVGNAGLEIFGHDDARGDVGPAVLWAVDRHRQLRDVDRIARQHDLLAGRLALEVNGRDRVVDALEDLLVDRLLGRLEGHQREPAVAVDARHQRKIRTGLREHERRPLDRTGLGEGFGNVVFGRDGPCYVDELAGTFQGGQESA